LIPRCLRRGSSLFFIIIFALNHIAIKIKNFFSIPGNIAITVIIISIFIGSLLFTVKKLKKDAEINKNIEAKKRKAEFEEIIRMEEEERIRKEENISKDIDYAQNFLKYISDIISNYIIIDSNIWMDFEYDNFFIVIREACCNYKCKINIHSIQFDEIVNIKKNKKAEIQKRKKAWLAIKRIEELQKENILDINQISINPNRKAYADPLIIKLLSEQAQKGVKTTLISNDRELCIRARQILKDKSTNAWAVLDFNSLLNDCNFYVKTMQYKIDINNFNPETASELPN